MGWMSSWMYMGVPDWFWPCALVASIAGAIMIVFFRLILGG